MKKQLLFLFIISLAATVSAMATPLTNVVPLTPCLTFYLQKAWVAGPAKQFKSDEMICETLSTGGSNIIFYRGLPSFAQSWDFKLFDDNGREVAKTKEGLANSKPPRPPSNELDLRRNFKIGAIKWDDIHNLFRPDKMFMITNKGVYLLEVRVRICVPMTNGIPDPNAMHNIHQFLAATNFSIIESPPVRVEVIKKWDFHVQSMIASFKDYLQFQPDGGIWVTLGIITWDSVGTAEQDFGGNWSITTDVSPDPSGPDNSDEFPHWTVNQSGMH